MTSGNGSVRYETIAIRVKKDTAVLAQHSGNISNTKIIKPDIAANQAILSHEADLHLTLFYGNGLA